MVSYENYEIKNNVFGTLSAPISSLATTIQLGDGQGQRFSVNQLATLENIENGKVMKREIVLITAINGDVLTVERKYKPCPANYDANTQGQVSYAFSADDTISAYIDKEHFDEIDKSINDIYDNGVNKLRTEVISGLQIKVNAGPVLVGSGYYDFAGGNLTLTDNATNYIEIDQDGLLVSNTIGWGDENTKISKVITSGGEVTNIEDWRLGTVGGRMTGLNIHDLPEKEYIKNEDEIVVADSENIFNNKKVQYSVLNEGQVFGTGGDGDLVVNTSACLANGQPAICFIEAKTRNFRNLTICSGSRLAFCGTGNPVIRVSGCLCNLGIIDTYNGQQALRDCFRALNFGVLKNAIGVSGCVITQKSSGGTANGSSGRAGTCIRSTGGRGGNAGQNGTNGTQYTMCGYTVYGGTGGAGATCAGGGGGGGGMEWGGTCAQGCDGCPATPCYGGNGGDGGSVSGCSAGGGGGGYGYCRGGKGGNGSTGRGLYGGDGGDSMFCGGDGGQSCCAGNGGYGHLIKGGDGGASHSSYTCATHGGRGGDSIWGNGGTGGRNCDSFNGCGGQPGSGGNSIWGNGGNAGTSASSYCVGGHCGGRGRNGGSVSAYSGGCGGNAIGSRYTIVVFAKNFYNNCICANGGNGGNGSAYNGIGGNGTNGGNVYIIYGCCFTQGSINVAGGSGGTGETAGCAGCDGELIIGQYS